MIYESPDQARAAHRAPASTTQMAARWLHPVGNGRQQANLNSKSARYCSSPPLLDQPTEVTHFVGTSGTAPRASVPGPGVAPETCFVAAGGMVTNGGLREQEVRQNLKPSSQGKAAQDSDGRPDTVSEQLTAVSCQYGTSPWALGVRPHGHGTLETQGWGPKRGSQTCSPTFRPQAFRAIRAGTCIISARAVSETCSAADRSDLPT